MNYLKKLLFVLISTIVICSCSGDKDIMNVENQKDDFLMIGLKPTIHSSSTKINTKTDNNKKQLYIVKIFKYNYSYQNYAYCICDDLEKIKFRARKNDRMKIVTSFIEDFAETHAIYKDNGDLDLKNDYTGSFGPYCIDKHSKSIELNKMYYSNKEVFPYLFDDVLKINAKETSLHQIKRYLGLSEVTIVDESTEVPIDIFLWGFGLSVEMLNLDEGIVEFSILDENISAEKSTYSVELDPINKSKEIFLTMSGLHKISKDDEVINKYGISIIWKRKNRDDVIVCEKIYKFKRMYLNKFKINVIKDFNNGFSFNIESKDFKGEDIQNIN